MAKDWVQENHALIHIFHRDNSSPLSETIHTVRGDKTHRPPRRIPPRCRGQRAFHPAHLGADGPATALIHILHSPYYDYVN